MGFKRVSDLKLNAGGEQLTDQGLIALSVFEAQLLLLASMLLLQLSNPGTKSCDLHHHPSAECSDLEYSTRETLGIIDSIISIGLAMAIIQWQLALKLMDEHLFKPAFLCAALSSVSHQQTMNLKCPKNIENHIQHLIVRVACLNLGL